MEPQNAKLKHSMLGIVSFVMSLVSLVLLVLLVVVAGVIEMTTPGGMAEDSAAAIIIGLGFILLLVALVVALILGIAGLFSRDRRKILAILGIVFSGLAVLAGIAILILGATVG